MFTVILGVFGSKATGDRFLGAKVEDFNIGSGHKTTASNFVVICHSTNRQDCEDIAKMLNEEHSIWRDAFVNPRRPNFRRGLPPEAIERIMVRARDRFETLKIALGED